MPYYYYEDADGDQVACLARRLLSVDLAPMSPAQRLMPVLAIKGKPELRWAAFQSLAGKPLAGPGRRWRFRPRLPPLHSRDRVGGSAACPAAAPVVAPTTPPAEPEPAAAAPAAAAVDAELDALLASLNAPAPTGPPPAAGEPELDPGLAALLADL